MNKKTFSGKLFMSVILFATSVIITIISTLGWFTISKTPRSGDTSFEVIGQDLDIKFYKYQFTLDANNYPTDDGEDWNINDPGDPNYKWLQLQSFYLGPTPLLPKQKLFYKIEVTNLSDKNKIIVFRFMNLKSRDSDNIVETSLEDSLAKMLWVRMWCDIYILPEYRIKHNRGIIINYDAVIENNEFTPLLSVTIPQGETAVYYFMIEFASESVSADIAGKTLELFKIKLEEVILQG